MALIPKADAVKARVVSDESVVTKQLVNAYAVRKADPSDLITLAGEVQRADEEIRHVASGKLTVIAEQIRFLQQQARGILEEAKESAQLHQAQCNFVKKPGTIYYLYERASGTSYFSMLSPKEWSNCPHIFLGAYRLEFDRSWTKVENINKKDEEIHLIDKLMSHGGLPSIEYIAGLTPKEEEEKKISVDEEKQ